MLLPCVCVCRYEDNFDAVNNLVVLVQKVGKNSIEELGSPDKFLADNAYLFGESAAFTGESGLELRQVCCSADAGTWALVVRCVCLPPASCL